MEKIFEEIRTERNKQDQKWGQQNHPVLNPDLKSASAQCSWHALPEEDYARTLVDKGVKEGTLTFMNILVEEISEAASCQDAVELRKELIQSTAVLVAMIESLERNGR